MKNSINALSLLLLIPLSVLSGINMRAMAGAPDTGYVKGLVHSHDAGYDNTGADLDKTADTDPYDGNTWHDRGNTALSLSNDSIGLKEYTSLIKLNHRNGMAYYNRGLIENRAKEYNKAKGDFTKAIKLDHSFYRAYYKRGFVKYKLGDLKGAVKDCNKAVRVHPCDTTYRSLGVLRVWMKQYKPALEAFNKSIELNPVYIDAYIRRARVEDHLKDYAASYRDLTKAIEIDTMYDEGLVERANMKEDIWEYASAIDDCNKAIALNRYNPQAFINRGWEKFMLRNDYDGAIADFNEALKLAPEFALAYSCLCATKDDMSKPDEALKDCNTALKLDPIHEFALVNRGNIRNRLGDLTGAKADYTQAIAVAPDDPLAYGNRRMTETRLQDYAGVAEDTKKITQVTIRDNDTVVSGRGWVKYLIGDYDGALQDENRAIQLNPSLAHAYYIRGLAKIRTGDAGGGCTDLGEALQLGDTDAPNHINSYCK